MAASELSTMDKVSDFRTTMLSRCGALAVAADAVRATRSGPEQVDREGRKTAHNDATAAAGKGSDSGRSGGCTRAADGITQLKQRPASHKGSPGKDKRSR